MALVDDICGAVYRKDYQILQRLFSSTRDVDLRDEDGRSPLMHAVLAQDADPSMVKFLINNGANIDAVDRDQKWTALHFAARDQKSDIVRVLLESGAIVDPVDAFGNTPLWRALMAGSHLNIDVIKILLKYGADPTKKNTRGIAPIDIARNKGRTDVIALFENTAL